MMPLTSMLTILAAALHGKSLTEMQLFVTNEL